MHDAVQAFKAALQSERDAALRADFDRLLELQDEKRELLAQVKASATPEMAGELAEQARKNLVLLRHLAACVRGYLGLDAEPTYGAKGQSIEAPPSSLRGRL
jgi:hypothetical protein